MQDHCVLAEENYSVTEGFMGSCVIQDSYTPVISGFSPKDRNWYMYSNTGLPDSRVIGESHCQLQNGTTTEIEQQGEPVPINVTTAEGDIQERFIATDDGKLIYDGIYPASVMVQGTVVIDPEGSGTRVRLFIAKNGETRMPTSRSVYIPAGNQESQIFIMGALEVEDEDEIQLYVANEDGTRDLKIRGFGLIARG